MVGTDIDMMIVTGTEVIAMTGTMILMTGVMTTGVDVVLHLGIISVAKAELQTIQAILMIVSSVAIQGIVRGHLLVTTMIHVTPEMTTTKITNVQSGVAVVPMTGLPAVAGTVMITGVLPATEVQLVTGTTRKIPILTDVVNLLTIHVMTQEQPIQDAVNLLSRQNAVLADLLISCNKFQHYTYPDISRQFVVS